MSRVIKVKWVNVLYKGIETNIQVNDIGGIKKIEREWYGKKQGSYQITYGEVDLLKLKLTKQGYVYIKIQIKDAGRKSIPIHQLIASAFLGYKFGNRKVVVDHIDNNKINNNLCNLQLITQRENIIKSKEHRDLPTGVFKIKTSGRYRATITYKGVKKVIGNFLTCEDAEKAYNSELKGIKNNPLMWQEINTKSSKKLNIL